MFEQDEVKRLRLPREGEVLGIAVAMMGAGHVTVECEDGLTRMGRIPGKIAKRVWVRVGDLVLIEPWKIEPTKKADIVWRYTKTEANFVKRKGYGKNLNF